MASTGAAAASAVEEGGGPAAAAVEADGLPNQCEEQAMVGGAQAEECANDRK